MITIIAAIGKNNALGKDNRLIWHLPADLKRFKKITLGNPVIMGRKTFESIGKPLPGRVNIVITKDKTYKKEGCTIVHSLKQAVRFGTLTDTEIFIIGGAAIYKQAIAEPWVNALNITHIHKTFDADVFFPEIDTKIWEVIHREDYKADSNNNCDYSFVSYTRKFL